jgi:hypothetical protein
MNRHIERAVELAGNVLDRLSERTGIVVMPDRLLHPVNDDVVTLDVPGYRQTNTFSCGFTAAAMVMHYFFPRRSLNRLYDLVGPDPEIGVPTDRMIDALRKSRIAVRESEDLRWNDIRRAICAGLPIILTVNTRKPDVLHWCVIYGAGRKPNRLFVAGQGIPWLGRKEYSFQEFRRTLWNPVGNGLICRKK